MRAVRAGRVVVDLHGVVAGFPRELDLVALGGGPGVAFGDGHLCINRTPVRFGIVFASGGVSHYSRHGIDPPVSVAGSISAGNVRHYQMWFRDGDSGFCTSSTFDLTNGFQMTWAQ